MFGVSLSRKAVKMFDRPRSNIDAMKVQLIGAHLDVNDSGSPH